jgi:hypothetical protein
VRQDFELEMHLVRLKLGSGNLGQPSKELASLLHRRRRVVRAGQDITEERLVMRSDLVFGALSHVSNRYQLCQLASKATRKLHKPNTRLQDTTNEVLGRFHTTNPGSPAPIVAPVVHPVERRRAA